MNWFYAENGQQLGPVSDVQLIELYNLGRIKIDTLVWREGMAEWQALGVARPGLPPPPPVSTLQTTMCVECGQTFPTSEMIQLNQTWVCAQCKPIFLQRMTEGVAPTAPGGLWRFNKQLVTVSEMTFPDRCVKCNAPANGFKMKRTLYWQHPAYYLLLLCNLLILLIVVMIVRKKAVLHVGLCDTHRAKRKQYILIGWIGSAVGFMMIIAGASFNSAWPALLGVVLLLFCMIYGLIRSPMISAAKIDKQNVWVRGVGADFLANLPQWPGT